MSALLKNVIGIIIFSSSYILSANTYYVSPVGNDLTGTGSINSPWFTLNRAWKLIATGDTIYMRGGTYNYGKQELIGKNGSPEDLIRIFAYPGETPVLKKYGKFAGNYWPRAILRISGNYIHIKGLEICYNTQENNDAYYGLIIYNGNNNICESLNVHHNGGTGISIENNSNDNLILNCDTHHNSDPLSTIKYGNADGIGLSHVPAGMTNRVRGCRFWWNSDDGIDPFGSDSRLIIDNCWSWYNGYIPDTFLIAGDGNGFKLGKSASDMGNIILISVSRCVSYKNRTAGFHQNNLRASVELFNNTAYLNGTVGFWLNDNNKPHVIKNNISYKNESYCYLTAESELLSNTFFINNKINPEYSVDDTDFQSLDGIQLDEQRKSDGSLPDLEFMHLSPESDLIDKGVDTKLPFSGKAPDIGSFEVINGELDINMSPIISISSSTKGESLIAPATFSIEIEAMDPDGTIGKIELFNGPVKLVELTSLPYSFTLKDLPAGSYSIKAVATDNLKNSVVSETLEFRVNSNNDYREDFSLHPNPNNGCFSIDYSVPGEAGDFTMFVMNMTGKTVYKKDLLKNASNHQFDLSFLTPGTYILLIKNNLILATQKLIKV